MAKTVTSVNLGIGLASEGKKILLIDADPQGSVTISPGYEYPDKMDVSLATIMMKIINDEPIGDKEGILHHEEGVDILPGNIELSGLEISMNGVISRETVLKQYVDMMREQYGYIICDCMPSLGILTINALACADSVLIPVSAGYLPVRGLEQLIKTISRVKRQLNSFANTIHGICIKKHTGAIDLVAVGEDIHREILIFKRTIRIGQHSAQNFCHC